MKGKGRVKGLESLDHFFNVRVHKVHFSGMCAISVRWVRGRLYCSSSVSRRNAQKAVLSSSVSIGGYFRNLFGFVRFGGLGGLDHCKALFLTFRKLTNIAEERARG